MGLLPFDVKGSRPTSPDPVSVTHISQLIVKALAEGLPASITVRGEISNLTIRNGHWFFSLRDADSAIDAVMWASQARMNRHRAEDGESVLVTGRVGHWTKGGRTRFEARKVEPDGKGDLHAAFLKLCGELRELGWFDESHKKPLPAWPRRVGVITSAQGAALTDVMATARSRFPSTSILVVDVRVQGDSAAGEVRRAIEKLDSAAGRLGLDAIIVTRGGGSAEDLNAFNDRGVAEAAFAARTPVIAAIGHESDTTIIELVADCRASTPTQAVTLLLPHQDEVLERIQSFTHRLEHAVHRTLSLRHQVLETLPIRLSRASEVNVKQGCHRVESLSARLAAARPDRMLVRREQQVEHVGQRLRMVIERDLENRPSPLILNRRLAQAIQSQWRRRADHVAGLERALAAIDPLAVLQRGYSITTDASGRTIRNASVKPGDSITTRVASGLIDSRVEGTREQGA